jgi:hypothetical protein
MSGFFMAILTANRTGLLIIFSVLLFHGIPSASAHLLFHEKNACYLADDDSLPGSGIWPNDLCQWQITAGVNDLHPVGTCSHGSTCQYDFIEYIYASPGFGHDNLRGTLFKGSTAHAHLAGSCDFDASNQGCRIDSEPATHGHTSGGPPCHDMRAEANIYTVANGVQVGHIETGSAYGYCLSWG